jgi:uncharacterized membrane protein
MFIKLFVIALPVFFVIDMVWLVLVAKKFYHEQIGFLMKPDINWLAIFLFFGQESCPQYLHGNPKS